MKKMIILITTILALIVLFIRVGLLFMDINQDKDTTVTYKSTSQFGIAYEIPNNYKETLESTGDEYAYTTPKGDFKLTVQQSEATGATVSQYVSVSKGLFTDGSVTIDGVTTTRKCNYINGKCTVANVNDKNGIEMGNVVVKYDYENKGKTTNITEQMYGIKVKDTIVQFDFVSETEDVEKYKEIVGYVVNSIKVNN